MDAASGGEDTASLGGGLPRLKLTTKEEVYPNGITGRVSITKVSLEDGGYRF